MKDRQLLDRCASLIVQAMKEGKTQEEAENDPVINQAWEVYSKSNRSPLRNGYDTWHYTRYNLNYGCFEYKDIIYDCDDFDDRGTLMGELLEDEIIHLDNERGFRIVHPKVLVEINETFNLVAERNTRLNSRAIILNLRETSYLKKIE